MKIKFALSLLLLLTLSSPVLLLSACADDEDQPTTSAEPPAVPEETIPLIQDPQNEIWRPGHWALGESGFYWVPGKIIPRPDPTAVWNSDHWVQHTYGWSFEKGHWE